MAKAALGGVEVEVDEDGFIQEPEKWSHGVAEDLAKSENAFPMSEEHWKLVNYLRDYYREIWNCPAHPHGGEANRIRFKEDLSVVSGRSGEGGLQGGGFAETNGLRLKGISGLSIIKFDKS